MDAAVSSAATAVGTGRAVVIVGFMGAGKSSQAARYVASSGAGT